MESEEASAIEQLLKAYEEGDQETADGLVKSPLFRYMENDVSYLLCYSLVVRGVTIHSCNSELQCFSNGAMYFNNNILTE